MSASQQARAAVRAIKEGHRWGTDATITFLDKRRAFNHFMFALDFEVRRKARRSK